MGRNEGLFASLLEELEGGARVPAVGATDDDEDDDDDERPSPRPVNTIDLDVVGFLEAGEDEEEGDPGDEDALLLDITPRLPPPRAPHLVALSIGGDDDDDDMVRPSPGAPDQEIILVRKAPITSSGPLAAARDVQLAHGLPHDIDETRAFTVRVLRFIAARPAGVVAHLVAVDAALADE